MSLKGFHIIFIVLAFLCSAGFWAWSIWDVESARSTNAVVLGNLSGSLALALFVYGAWFIFKKARTIIV